MEKLVQTYLVNETFAERFFTLVKEEIRLRNAPYCNAGYVQPLHQNPARPLQKESDCGTGDKLYHYTTAEGARGIVQDKKFMAREHKAVFLFALKKTFLEKHRVHRTYHCHIFRQSLLTG